MKTGESTPKSGTCSCAEGGSCRECESENTTAENSTLDGDLPTEDTALVQTNDTILYTPEPTWAEKNEKEIPTQIEGETERHGGDETIKRKRGGGCMSRCLRVLCARKRRHESDPVPAFYFALFPIFATSISVAFYTPHLPNLYSDFFNNDAQYVFWAAGVVRSAANVGTLFTGSSLGKISDCVGRKPLISLGVLAALTPGCILALGVNFWAFMISRGVCGFFAITTPVLAAYIADTSVPHKRTEAIGYLLASGALGAIIGSLAGGMIPFMYAKYAPPISLVVTLIYLWFMPESLNSQDMKEWSEIKHTHPLKLFKHLTITPLIKLLAVIAVLDGFQSEGFTATIAFYQRNRFSFTPEELGKWIALGGFLVLIMYVFLLNHLVKWFGEKALVLFSMLVGMVTMFGYAVADEKWMIWMLVCFACITFLTFPTVQGVASQEVPSVQQGLILVSIQAVKDFAAALGPLVYGIAAGQASLTDDHNPGSYLSPRQSGYYHFIGVMAFFLGTLVAIKIQFTSRSGYALGKIAEFEFHEQQKLRIEAKEKNISGGDDKILVTG